MMAGTPARSPTTTAVDSGRLVRWPRPGSEGESGRLTLVDEPDLVRALDQLGAAMAVAYHGSWGAAGSPAVARGGTDRKLLAACHELSLIAEFLEATSAESRDSGALAELAKGKARELRDIAEELEASAARDMPERPDDGLDREGHDGSGAARSEG